MARGLGHRLALILGLALCLSSCFQSDLTLRFDHQNHGQLSQGIDLGERRSTLVQSSLAPWLNDLEQRVHRLGGNLRQEGSTLQLTIPFGTPQNLVTRFTELFAAEETSPTEAGWLHWAVPGLGLIPFQLAVEQHHWGLATRTHLTYDLDLTGLAWPDSSPGNPGNDSSAAIFFCLETPWGIRQVRPASLIPLAGPRSVTRWQLQWGQRNHVDVIFWLPSLVGLGALAIVALVLLGYFLRYRWLSPPQASSSLSFGQK